MINAAWMKLLKSIDFLLQEYFEGAMHSNIRRLWQPQDGQTIFACFLKWRKTFLSVVVFLGKHSVVRGSQKIAAIAN